ncbi:hypothetical protein C942_01059 [Photobacterium marinum]|uniref:AB hydrolase-1 domain-containing protein n=1 Tax=Photobacterium marinum TaxID=1056511 RepID=L8J988_9GAMM|nr:alpha/beta fold hydrolase [Photobacterium marinum]ELR65445.1 hypothetical protein C942_01059 [Photobacterium marinum]
MFTHRDGEYLSVGDADIYFETTGNKAGKPLVFLHGGLGSIVDFNPILERFSDHYYVVGIDFRGHGKSSLGTGRLSYARYQEDVELVLRYLGITAFSVLGFSDGGIVGYRLAANAQNRVKKLIALGAQWRLESNDPSFPLLAGLTSDSWMESYPDSVEYYTKINPDRNFERLIQSVVEDLWLDLDVSGYPKETVDDIRCSVLIARGDEDELFSLREAVELTERIMNSSFLNIPFVGHAAHQESPEIFSMAVKEFLE